MHQVGASGDNEAWVDARKGPSIEGGALATGPAGNRNRLMLTDLLGKKVNRPVLAAERSSVGLADGPQLLHDAVAGCCQHAPDAVNYRHGL